MKKLMLLVLCSGICFQAFSEYRIWKDKKGNSIEAEFVCISGGKVVMRSRAGRVLKFDPSGLCAADQEYLENSIPPKIEVVFSKKQDRKKHGNSYSAEVFMSGSVQFEKKNREPYVREMKAVLMMVGEDQRSRNYIMLDVVDGLFDFKETSDFSLVGNEFRMYEDRYDNSSGTDYVGYIAVVFDDAGEVLAVKSSRKDFVENCAKLAGFKAGSRFSKKFIDVNRIRTF